jgi:hypothetical protein
MDISAMSSVAEGKLFQLSFKFTNIVAPKITSLVFQDIKSQPGPVPSYNYGLLWDNSESSAR